MCMEGTIQGLGGMAKAALWATWVPLGCTNIPPNGASEPCPGRLQRASNEPLHNGLLFGHDTKPLTSEMGLYLQRKIVAGLTHSRDPGTWRTDPGKTYPLPLCSSVPCPLRRGNVQKTPYHPNERRKPSQSTGSHPHFPKVWATSGGSL